MKKIILYISVLLLISNVLAQATISGRVTDEIGEGIPFANIGLLNNDSSISYGAISDFDGFFVFKIPMSGEIKLQCTTLGYAKETYQTIVKENDSIYIEMLLEQNEAKIEEVVVSYKLPIHNISACSITNQDIFLATDMMDVSDNLVSNGDFIKTAEESISTFSVDVDQGAYTLMRNKVFNRNELPQKEEVRIEEYINYFDYNYKEPENGKPIGVESNLVSCPWNDNAVLLHIGLQTQSLKPELVQQNNLVFLIDVSGSMSEELNLIKDALKFLTSNLNEIDKVSIVTYADGDEVLLNSVSVKDSGVIIAAIDKLTSGGGTYGEGGIKGAYKVAQENFIKNGNNRVILCTDGDFNLGISGKDVLVKLIEEYSDENIFLTVCQLGNPAYADDRMEQLADNGNGSYYFLDDLPEAMRVFGDKLQGTIFTVAKDVKLQLIFDENIVSEYRLIGYDNRKLNNEDFKNDKKDAGEVGSGQSVTALYELILKPNAGLQNLAKFKMRYKEPNGNKSKELSFDIEQTALDINKDAQFASVVAALGMKLGEREMNNAIDWDRILKLTTESLKQNKDPLRLQFLDLLTHIIDEN